MEPYLIAAGTAYFLGSIPFGYILVRFFLKHDIRTTGSGNIGATNVARSGAKGLAIATLVLDAGKGFAAVALTFAFFAYALVHDPGSEFTGMLGGIAGLSAVLGHMFPPWLKFRGGKGVATAVGAFAVLAPKSVAAALVIFIIVVAATRYVSLGSMLGAASVPITAYVWPPWL